MESLNIELGDSVEAIHSRLPEVILWCKSRADVGRPRTCFRSVELMPHPLEAGRKRVVRSVRGKRYLALGRPKENPSWALAGGRLLIYEPDINLAHGLEEDETDGYVDLDNTPPWDTWIAYVYEEKRNYLLSWVPGEFVELVSAGIRVSPEECFSWLDSQELVLASMLRRLGVFK